MGRLTNARRIDIDSSVRLDAPEVTRVQQFRTGVGVVAAIQKARVPQGVWTVAPAVNAPLDGLNDRPAINQSPGNIGDRNCSKLTRSHRGGAVIAGITANVDSTEPDCEHFFETAKAELLASWSTKRLDAKACLTRTPCRAR
jgi:hypothetical protein